ncbi:MAG TPA: hypothetical protein [Siphovirus LN-2020-2]|nr:MAG TPA: hypothetical protein [Siphovirus LN-2020-2]
MSTTSIIFESRDEAECVLNHLITICIQRGVATVGDLYSLTGLSKSYIDENWGWRDLRSAHAIRTHNGYILNLPKLEDVRTSDDAVNELCNSLNEKEYFVS